MSVVVEVHAPLASQTLAVFSGAFPSRPPAISTLPPPSGVTLAPRRFPLSTAPAPVVTADQEPGATVTVSVGAVAAAAPAALDTPTVKVLVALGPRLIPPAAVTLA